MLMAAQMDSRLVRLELGAGVKFVVRSKAVVSARSMRSEMQSVERVASQVVGSEVCARKIVLRGRPLKMKAQAE